MSVIKANKHQIGSNATASKNIVLEANTDGDLVISKGVHDGTLTEVQMRLDISLVMAMILYWKVLLGMRVCMKTYCMNSGIIRIEKFEWHWLIIQKQKRIRYAI